MNMGKKFLITAAQAAARPNLNFVRGLENYARIHKAELLILPMIGNSARQDWDEIHPKLKKHNILYKKLKLNNNIQISQFHVRPYQVDPLTGLARFAQRETTQIFASPKQRMKAVPHSNNKIPKLLVTTGACTQPNYASGNDVSAERRRLGGIAKRDHVYGALIVEIENKEIFHLRNIRSNGEGKFVDLGVMYDGDQTRKSELEALVLGDIHTGYTDPKVKKINLEMISEYQPKRIVLHDFFDGHSISHHKDKALISQLIKEGTDKDFLDLEGELGACYNELMELHSVSNGTDIYVVGSNHLEFLDRYLDEGRFIKDPTNARMAFHLATSFAEGENPVEAGIKMIGSLPDNIHFLRRDEDLKVKGYQLGSHGDKGASGGKGSITTKENDFGKSITGHVHSAEVLRETYVVGTSTPLTIFYNKGQPTKWTNTNAMLWDDGRVQMINIIKGQYKLRK